MVIIIMIGVEMGAVVVPRRLPQYRRLVDRGVEWYGGERKQINKMWG